MGASNSKQSSDSKNDSETLRWNDVMTENISPSGNNFYRLSDQAKQIVINLNMPMVAQTETSDLQVDDMLEGNPDDDETESLTTFLQNINIFADKLNNVGAPANPANQPNQANQSNQPNQSRLIKSDEFDELDDLEEKLNDEYEEILFWDSFFCIIYNHFFKLNKS